MSVSNKEHKPQYTNYKNINIPNDYVNIVIGKKFKNINNIKSLSPHVIVSFVSDREKNTNRFIVKSNDNVEFERVIKNIYNLLDNSYNVFKNIKKQEKEKRKVQAKLREIKIRSEISKKIEKEMKDKEMEKIKLSCVSEDVHKEELDRIKTEQNYEKFKSKNPFYGLEVASDED